MDETGLGILSFLIRLIMVILPLAVVGVGLGRVYSRRAVAPRATRRALFPALAMGGFTAVVVDLLGAGLAGMDVGIGPEHFLWALPYALALGGAVTLAGLAGYGIFTIGRRGTPLSIAGIIIAPVVLVAWIVALGTFAAGLDERASILQANRRNAELQERSSAITARVEVVSVAVDRLTIDLVLVASAEVRLTTGGFVTANQVPYDIGTPDVFSKLTPDDPIVLRPGEPMTYRVEFEPGPAGGQMPRPGPWSATVWLKRDDGEVLIIKTQFVVPPPGTSAP